MLDRLSEGGGLLPWLRRRLSPGEYLGLHLTIGLLLSLTALGLFALVAHLANGDGIPSHFDRDISERLYEHRQGSPGARYFFWMVTQLGDIWWLVLLGVFVGTLLYFRKQRRLCLVWAIALAGGGLLDACLKLFFQRPRPEPPIRDFWLTLRTTSFPSGHSMGSVIGYVLLAYLLWLVLPHRWARRAAILVPGLLILAIGFSRIYLGAHWFTDVVGGYLAGLVWVTACITAIDTVRRRRVVNGRAERAAP